MHFLRRSVLCINNLRTITVRSTLTGSSYNTNLNINCRTYKNESDIPQSSSIAEKGGFAKAFEKQSTIADSPDLEQNYTFASLLRNSKLIDFGDPVGKVVIGRIFHIVEDDLYIDFGWKFHCVCTRPVNRGNEYVRGARVRIQINDLELSSRFLGSSCDLTLLEADCRLIGLVSSPNRPIIGEK